MKLKLGLSYFAVFCAIVLVVGLFFGSGQAVLATDCTEACNLASGRCNIVCDSIVDFGEEADCRADCDAQLDTCGYRCINEEEGNTDASGCCVVADKCFNGITASQCSTDGGNFDAGCETDACVLEAGTSRSAGKNTKLVPTCTGVGIEPPGGLFKDTSTDCVACGDCKICDFLTVANNLAKIIFSIMGAVAFAMFMWAGTGFITAGGEAEKIKASKDTIVAVIWGLVIIVLAWQLVHVVIVFLQPQENDDPATFLGKGGMGQLFSKPWDDPKCD